MSESKNNRVESPAGKSKCGSEATRKSFYSNKRLTDPEHRRNTRRRNKRKKTTNATGKTVKIPLVELAKPIRQPGNCSQDAKQGCFSPPVSRSEGSSVIRLWLNVFCIEVNNDFNPSTLCRLVETLKKI